MKKLICVRDAPGAGQLHELKQLVGDMPAFPVGLSLLSVALEHGRKLLQEAAVGPAIYQLELRRKRS